MSDHKPLLQTLKKITITVVHAVTEGAMDPFTLEENFHHANRIRMIIGPTQVMEFHHATGGGYDLVLRFSPDYLQRNYYELLGVTAEFEWTFSLPKYIFTDYVDENGKDKCDELGIVEWLTLSTVTVSDKSLSVANWPHKDFEASFAAFS